MVQPIARSSSRAPLGRGAFARAGIAASPAQPSTAARALQGSSRDVFSLGAAAPVDLTAEEQSFLEKGTLPANYPELKASLVVSGKAATIALARKGLSGPFSERFGDPVEMVHAARRLEQHPELMRWAKDLRKGDILVVTWNSTDDIIRAFTKGPFTHALLVTNDGPAAEFIEAIGITAPNDPTADRVRRVSLADEANSGQTFRLLRPTAGMNEADRLKAVDKAVAYAEKQLGKPYDYAFTDKDHRIGQADAYYCSELVTLAYTEGAGVAIAYSKSGQRDDVMVGLTALADALGPKNRLTLATRLFHFVQGPKPTTTAMAAYIVDEVLPGCYATERLGKTPAERKRLAAAITEMMEGKAFPRFEAAMKAKKGKRESALAIAQDVRALLDRSGVEGFEAFKLGKTLLLAVLPHSATLLGFVFGKDSEQAVSATRILDQIDGLRGNVAKVPFVGRFLAKLVPGRVADKVKRDFVSPTDLAWATGVYHEDYNVQAGHPLTPSARISLEE